MIKNPQNNDHDKYPATVPFLTMPAPMQKQKAKSSEAISKGFYENDFLLFIFFICIYFIFIFIRRRSAICILSPFYFGNIHFITFLWIFLITC